MSDTAPTAPAEPDGAPRLLVLDIMRGAAILGILFMNISDFGGSLYAFFAGDVRRPGWTGADQVAWWLREVFASNTARGLLEMLFGAGMVILTDRAAATAGPWRVLRDYAWRNLVLFLFGLVHVFLLLWPGDILHSYALAALVAMGFRTLRPRLLIVFGLVLATLQLVGGGSYTVRAMQRQAAVAHIVSTPADLRSPAEREMLADSGRARIERARDRATMRARADAEDRARSGTPLSWAWALWGVFAFFQRSLFEVTVVWEAAGTMLIGAALYKLGVLQGLRSRSFYVRLMLLAYGVALPLRAWAAYETTRFAPGPDVTLAFGEYARLGATLGHVALVNLLVMSAAGLRWMRPVAAAGRTALTLYVLQTLVCLWVLYPPWGLRLYGQQGWAALMLTALLVDAALLAFAMWWTKRFAIAPVEWAWRSIVAGRQLPFRRERA